MKAKRIVIGTLVSFVVLFLLGAVIFGFLLSGFMEANTNPVATRPREEMKVGMLFCSNLLTGLLLALLIDWTNRTRFAQGLAVGATLGFLVALSFDLSMHAMTTLYSNFAVIVVDAIAYAIMLGVAAGCGAAAMAKWGGPKAQAA
jgi:hypothetical protein